jgi:hypothetical protein
MDLKDIATPDDIKQEVLEFIYQNAVKYLESVHTSMESISNRSIVLLSYLMIVVGFTTSHTVSGIITYLRSNGSHNTNYYNLYFISLSIVLILYYIWIIWDIVHYSKPRLANVAYSQPQDILGAKMNAYGAHMLKFVRCIELQTDIEEDISTMTDMFCKFEHAIDRAFIFPKLIKYLRACLLNINSLRNMTKRLLKH